MSSNKTTFSRCRPYSIINLGNHIEFFYQGHPIMNSSNNHSKVFSTTTPVKPENFDQALKAPDRTDWIKVVFVHYNKTVVLES